MVRIDTKHPDNTNRHFRGQQRAEKVVTFTRKHPIVLARIVLITLCMFAASATTFLIIPFERMKESVSIQLTLFVLVLMVMLTFHMFFLRIMNFYLDIVIITNYRVIDMRKSLFMHDDKEIIDLHEIQDTKKTQNGILANFLNYGTIVVVIPSLTTSMHLPYMPKPEYYLNQINQTKRGYILDRRRQKFHQRTTTESKSAFDHNTSHKGIQYGPKPHEVKT